jgi:hypothetical protein
MNVEEYKVSKILFIKGVFIKDCIPIDDIFEQKIIDQLNIVDMSIEVYKIIPANFTDLQTWTQNTNIKCWYCDLNFDNMPVFIPRLIEPAKTDTGYNIGTFGCFCSFCCALSYNNINNSKICENIRVKKMLMFLYKIFNGKSVKEILPSPSKYQMNHYGGSMDQIVYRNKIHKLKKNMKALEINV